MIRNGEDDAGKLMEDPDGAEVASGWQCAESGWSKSAPSDGQCLQCVA